MNRQPYEKPPRWWEPRLTPWCVRFSRKYRLRQLRVRQKLIEIECRHSERVREAVDQGKGVMIVPNHSAHYDSAALYIAADRMRLPLYFMTAWQVFAMSGRWEQWAMQRLGCFSIDREGTDRQAFKEAVSILQDRPCPLVIFPEGDIFHTTDHVTTFREGAAAIALSAARRGERPVVVIPCGIKFWYVDDPTDHLLAVTAEIERRLYLRVWPEETLPIRIHRLAEAALALKELDYIGNTRSGHLRDRIELLTEWVLKGLEQRYEIAGNGCTPERVKVLRQHLISRIEQQPSNVTSANQSNREIGEGMEDLFFIMQLFSYRGDYLIGDPSTERLAETLDKLEEDILDRNLPTVRGRRRAVIEFGEPIEVPGGRQSRNEVSEMTGEMRGRVQAIINRLNDNPSA